MNNKSNIVSISQVMRYHIKTRCNRCQKKIDPCDECENKIGSRLEFVIGYLAYRPKEKFIYKKINLERSDDQMIKEFFDADFFSFDNLTMDLILRKEFIEHLREHKSSGYKTPFSKNTKKLIEILVNAGILPFANDCLGRCAALDRQFFVAWNKDLEWLVDLGFKPTENSYNEYMKRTDKTTSEKLEMFEYLRDNDVPIWHKTLKSCKALVMKKSNDKMIELKKWLTVNYFDELNKINCCINWTSYNSK